MPRTTRTPASTALNRENQRRSRARHREYLDDLQRRIQEYEHRDAQATREMQHVARALAVENTILREMLIAKGVRREEVDARISGQVAFNANKVSAIEGPMSSENDSAPCEEARDFVNNPPEAPRAAASTRQDVGASSISPLQQQALRHELQQLDAVQSQQDQIVSWAHSYTGEPCEDSALSHAKSTGPGRCQPPDIVQVTSITPNHMPCLEAATILAQLRGHLDSREARAALGCAERRDCLIRNTDLLQLVDQMT
ncbi:hypothetical protein G7046_g6949 [Stylonectria norvegica]|nr:hypothetical protein G7046_g6949 [Stylonectria norvegica]